MNSTITQQFTAAYERRFGAQGDGISDPLSAVRNAAMTQFSETGIPLRSEAWKYTNVSRFLEQTFYDAEESSIDSKAFAFPKTDGWLAVCINGRYQQHLSHGPEQKGVVVTGLAAAAALDQSIAAEQLGSYALITDEPLVALNAAFATDGVYVKIDPGVTADFPIHIVNVIAGDLSVISQARHLINVGDAATATVVEHDIAKVAARCFTNTVVEAHVGPNASLEHYRLQEKAGADHVDSTFVRQERESRYKSCLVSTGDGVVRNNLSVHVAGEHCHTHLLGLALAAGKGHIDNYTLIDHAEPNCGSDELYKSILGGEAVSVFRGKLFVRKDAQKTAAFQSNRNLLLSDDAVANALPQLEIYADDVKCSHGATTGLLDQEALFYLRARGISRPQARRMLIEAFVDEVVSEMRDDDMRQRFGEILGSFLADTPL
ncbi:Fe-S cluster assembly protein SufD [Bacteroidota bacterium]